jgi:hypothetical protein
MPVGSILELSFTSKFLDHALNNNKKTCLGEKVYNYNTIVFNTGLI